MLVDQAIGDRFRVNVIFARGNAFFQSGDLCLANVRGIVRDGFRMSMLPGS
jgi:hypothetical protein